MAGGVMYQATKNSRKSKPVLMKKVKWGKMSKVSNSVKSYVKKALNKSEETKYHDTYSNIAGNYSGVSLKAISSSVPTADAFIMGLNQFSTAGLYNGLTASAFVQGTDNDLRVGDTINLQRITVHGEILVEDFEGEPNRVYEVMVLKEDECADRSNLALISDLTVLHTLNDRLGFENMDNVSALKNLKIIKRKTIKSDVSYGNMIPFNFTLKVNKKVSYVDATGLSNKCRYWLLAWEADGNATFSQIKVQSRMYFKDA